MKTLRDLQTSAHCAAMVGSGAMGHDKVNSLLLKFEAELSEVLFQLRGMGVTEESPEADAQDRQSSHDADLESIGL